MPSIKKTKSLKKELKLLDVYAIATGTTLSGGLFLLPGLAAIQAGQAMVLAYVIAAIPLIPAIFSIIELATAMPRAGGMYYFLDRTLGPAFGTIGGLGTWLALLLKVAFALIGIGAYLDLFLPNIPIIPIAICNFNFDWYCKFIWKQKKRKFPNFTCDRIISFINILLCRWDS